MRLPAAPAALGQGLQPETDTQTHAGTAGFPFPCRRPVPAQHSTRTAPSPPTHAREHVAEAQAPRGWEMPRDKSRLPGHQVTTKPRDPAAAGIPPALRACRGSGGVAWLRLRPSALTEPAAEPQRNCPALAQNHVKAGKKCPFSMGCASPFQSRYSDTS